MATPRINIFRRIWLKSPKLAFRFMWKKATRQAKKILVTKDEWNINWLGEEMRPFNSLQSNKQI